MTETLSPILDFVRSKLNEPGVNINEVARVAGVARNTVLTLKKGAAGDNGPGVKNVEAIAKHFGYKFDPAPLVVPVQRINDDIPEGIDQGPTVSRRDPRKPRKAADNPTFEAGRAVAAAVVQRLIERPTGAE